MYARGAARFAAWLLQHAPQVLSAAFRPTPGQDAVAAAVRYLSSASSSSSNTKKKRLPPLFNLDRLEPALFERFVLSLGARAGPSVLATMRSSLVRQFREQGRALPAAFAQELAVFFKGLRRRAARKRHRSGQRLAGGKDLLSFAAYRALCREMLRAELVFAHAFLTASWNLMCRAGNTATMRWAHLAWHEDALAVRFAHMKNDQAGTRPRDARHVYANPVVPEICPILVLAIYAAVWGMGGSDAKLVYPSSKQYDRFAKILKRLYHRHTDDDIGTRSVRKGAATYVASHSSGGPSAHALCIRAGWALPGVQNSYIRFEAAGGMVVGRLAAGLPHDAPEFATLPPFFPVVDHDIDQAVNDCFSMPTERTRTMRTFLLASLVYHHDFLRATLPDDHALRRNALFGNARRVRQLQQRVVCRLGTYRDRIRATGVPPYTALIAAVRAQGDKIDRIMAALGIAVESTTPPTKEEEPTTTTATAIDIPNASLATAWEHWCCGDPHNNTLGPYRLIAETTTETNKPLYSHYRCMMREVQAKVQHQTPLWSDQPTPAQARKMLAAVIDDVLPPANRERRGDQLSWLTVLHATRRHRCHSQASDNHVAALSILYSMGARGHLDVVLWLYEAKGMTPSALGLQQAMAAGHMTVAGLITDIRAKI